jgi:hypothetical protein
MQLLHSNFCSSTIYSTVVRTAYVQYAVSRNKAFDFTECTIHRVGDDPCLGAQDFVINDELLLPILSAFAQCSSAVYAAQSARSFKSVLGIRT